MADFEINNPTTFTENIRKFETTDEGHADVFNHVAAALVNNDAYLKENKVDKEKGKGLSTNDYTTEEKNKLSGIAEGAEVNVQADWNETNTKSDAYIKNKPKTMKNPNALDIKLNGVSQGVYDGSSQKNVNITAEKVGADSSGTAETKVSEHNASEAAHADIRELITNLATRLNALADSDDTTLDQLSEIVAYIKSNRSLIENITTKKVNVDDIIDNLTSSATNKPLSAQQGKVLKDLITALTSTVDGKADDVNGILTNATFQGTQATFLCPQQVRVSSGKAGNDGYIILARIKIISLYNGYPIAINFSQRGWEGTRTLYIRFLDRGDTLDVGLSSFYIDRSIGDYVGIAKSDTATWEIYVKKSQGWSTTCVHSFYYQAGMFEITFPGTEAITTLPDGCIQAQVIKNQASEILDDGNGNAIKVSYSKDGLDSANWLAAWNNYELRAISPNNLRNTINAVNKAGDSITGVLDSYVASATHLEGNKGKAIINSITAAGNYVMLDRLISTNGYFTDGVHGANRVFNYTKKETVDSDDNSVTYSVILLDENGNSTFPGLVSASRGSFKGNIEVTSDRSDTLNLTVPCAGYISNPLNFNKFKTFLGSYLAGDGQWNIISVRHQNGHGNDGQRYGMYLKCKLTEEGDLLWGQQIGDIEKWNPERTILDSVNYKDFCTPLSGGTIKPKEIILEKNEFYTKMDYDGVKTNDIYSISMYNKNNQFISGVNLNSNDFSPVNYASINSPYLDLGNIGYNTKWRNIYAQNGVIQTSDRTQKTNVANLETELTKKFIMGLIPCSYKMTKGTSGRTHYGLIAQDVEELMIQLGIDNTDFAGFIKSPKKIIKYEEHKDKNGNKVKKQIEEVIEGEYEYGLRYEEFIAPLIKVVQEQQETINKQQKEIEELKEEIKELKQFILKAV